MKLSLLKKLFMFILTCLMLVISVTGVVPARAALASKLPAAPIVKKPPLYTRDTTPVLSGKAAGGTRVNVWYLDDLGAKIQICKNVVVDDDDDREDRDDDREEEWGHWSCTSSVVLPEGKIELVVNATDKAGNTSEDTFYSFTVDTTAPDMPVVTAPPEFTNDTTPMISGTAEKDSLVNVWYLDDLGAKVQVCKNVAVDMAGGWTCVSSKVLPEREIELVVNATDKAGNTSADVMYAFTIDTTLVDTTPPTVVSIVRASTNPTSASSVDYTVTFSESVTGVDTRDFSLDATPTISSAAIGNVTGSGSTWTVTVNTGTGNGTLSLTVPATATVTDLAGNPLGGLPFTSAETYTVDKTQSACNGATYDDSQSNWIYSGSWATFTGSGPYNNSLHYTTTVGDYAELTFTGTQFTFYYTKDFNRGSIDVIIDGNKVTTINAYSATYAFQQTYTSPTYTEGNHTVRFVHAGGGTYIDVDAIAVLGAPQPVAAGTYDDTICNWVYNANWATTPWNGPYNNTLHYTSIVGDSAELLFSGTKFTLLFTKDSNRGLIDVYVDGNKIDTINAYAASYAFQQTYTSPTFADGNHTVRFVHAGGGAYIDIDAINICGAPTASAGTYDDTSCNWNYTGNWATTSAWNAAYNGTLHYTGTVGDYAEWTFTGTQFIFYYTKDFNRGLIDVYVDGNKIDTVNANSSTFAFQQTYTSPTLTEGNHTVRFVHAGGGIYIDVDAIMIQ